MGVTLSEQQIYELAKPLAEIVERFFQNPENEKSFQKWLKEQKKEEKQ